MPTFGTPPALCGPAQPPAVQRAAAAATSSPPASTTTSSQTIGASLADLLRWRPGELLVGEPLKAVNSLLINGVGVRARWLPRQDGAAHTVASAPQPVSSHSIGLADEKEAVTVAVDVQTAFIAAIEALRRAVGSAATPAVNGGGSALSSPTLEAHTERLALLLSIAASASPAALIACSGVYGDGASAAVSVRGASAAPSDGRISSSTPLYRGAGQAAAATAPTATSGVLGAIRSASLAFLGPHSFATSVPSAAPSHAAAPAHHRMVSPQPQATHFLSAASPPPPPQQQQQQQQQQRQQQQQQSLQSPAPFSAMISPQLLQTVYRGTGVSPQQQLPSSTQPHTTTSTLVPSSLSAPVVQLEDLPRHTYGAGGTSLRIVFDGEEAGGSSRSGGGAAIRNAGLVGVSISSTLNSPTNSIGAARSGVGPVAAGRRPVGPFFSLPSSAPSLAGHKRDRDACLDEITVGSEGRRVAPFPSPTQASPLTTPAASSRLAAASSAASASHVSVAVPISPSLSLVMAVEGVARYASRVDFVLRAWTSAVPTSLAAARQLRGEVGVAL